MSKRSRTRERRKEREKERQRRRQIYIVGAVVVIAVVVLALAVISNQPAEAPIPEDILERYEDINISQTLEGYYRMGESDAPVRVEEYSSFSCPGCAGFHETTFPALLDRVRAGEISFTFIPLQTGGIPNAEGAARAAICAGAQGRFWEMHDILFDWHLLYGNNAFSTNRLNAAVDGLGLNSGSFNSCFNSAGTSEILSSALQEGVGVTPSVAVNDTLLDTATLDSINEAIDAALAFAPSTNEPDVEATEEADMEATEEADMEATEEADMEATEEADMEATEEADMEATEEADVEATEEADMEATEEADVEATEEADMEATQEAES